MISLNKVFGLTAAAVALALAPASAQAQIGAAEFEVSITNITQAQIISPVLVASHEEDAYQIFEVGSPASDELAQVAEDAVLGPLMEKLMGADGVLDVQTITGVNGPILPGETATITVAARGQYRFVSLVGMLVTTNDAIVALQGVRGPNFGTGSHYAIAYDAGTEANTESCEHIPGPPCGNPGMRVTEGAEGFVYVHTGIQGETEDLASRYDWRNPVAKITISRPSL